MKIANLKIAHRLGLGFAAVLIILCVVATASFLSAKRIDRLVEVDMAEEDERVSAVAALKDLILLQAIEVRNVAINHDVKMQQQEVAEVKRLDVEIAKKFEAIEKLGLDAKSMELVLTSKKYAIEARPIVAEVLAAAAEFRAEASAEAIKTKCLPLLKKRMVALEALEKMAREHQTAALSAAAKATTMATTTILTLSAIGLLLGIVIAWRLTKSITAPISKATEVANAIAAGDLSANINAKGKDEIGDLMRALSAMSTNLRTIVADVKSSSESISTASAEIAQGNADLSSRTENQAGSLQQTASSVEQLTGTVKQNAESARQANQLASAASMDALRGGEVVNQVVTTMTDIQSSSKKIADIINVIDGIAFQTNILALNAAVEAARAGEQGRGFAVVAGEVRNLAQRSAQAAKEIKTLISASVEKVDDGSKLVSEAGVAMDEIVTSVKRVTDIIAEITAATVEQSGGIQQVNVAVSELDQMTQQNAALVEQSAAAAASLKDQAVRLTESIRVFKVDGTAPAAQANEVARVASVVATPSPVKPEHKAEEKVVAKADVPTPAPAKPAPMLTTVKSAPPKVVTATAVVPSSKPAPRAETSSAPIPKLTTAVKSTAGNDDDWTEF
jgi:methyl-accepting chemotaxis protein